jgi:hypothetical protein
MSIAVLTFFLVLTFFHIINIAIVFVCSSLHVNRLCHCNAFFGPMCRSLHFFHNFCNFTVGNLTHSCNNLGSMFMHVNTLVAPLNYSESNV